MLGVSCVLVVGCWLLFVVCRVCSLLVVCLLLRVVCGSLFGVRCWVFGGWRLVFAVCCLLLGVVCCCSLCVVRLLLFVVCFVLFVLFLFDSDFACSLSCKVLCLMFGVLVFCFSCSVL